MGAAMSTKSRPSFTLVFILLFSMIPVSPVSADDHYDYNDIGDPNDVQAQEMQAVWDSHMNIRGLLGET